ncbi:MAG: heparinase II/III-family protein, partial [Nitrospirota bacterium]|nr:heparinase II/III-family protein [Nitrospirota bacterium]
YTYDESGKVNWRVRFRETAAHNTVLIDGKNQTRYIFDKTRFKIKGPQPHYDLQTFVTQPGFDFLHGIARSQEYPVVHERKIFFVCPEYWIMTDLLIASEPHCYDLRFHLSALAEKNATMRLAAKTLSIHSPHLIMAQPAQDEIHPCIEEGYISQSYGVKQPAPIIKFSQRATCAVFHTVLVPYNTVLPVVSVETGNVYTEKGLASKEEASVLYMTINHQGKTSHDTYFVKHTSSEDEYSFDEMTCMSSGLFIRKDENGHEVRKHVF